MWLFLITSLKCSFIITLHVKLCTFLHVVFFVGKIYKSVEEEAQRRLTWLENRKLVLVHNMLTDQGIKSYRLGMNYFADMVKNK